MTRTEAVAGAAFAIAFLWVRLTNLGALPVFLDEAIHVDWALRIAETGRLLGVTDGGRYLPVWLWALVLPRFDDPLAAARACSALLGLFAAFALVWLGRELWRDRSGWVAAILYLLLPATLLYDRMAMMDALLCALVAGGLACAVRWARTAELTWAVAAGLAAGAAASTKLYGGFLLAGPVLALVLVPAVPRRVLRAQLPWILVSALAAMLPIFLDARANMKFAAENTWFFRSGASGTPAFGANLVRALAWSAEYLTLLGTVLVLFSAARSLGEGTTRLLVGFWIAWSLMFVLTGGRDWFPRYLLPALVPLLLLPAREAVRLGRELAARGVGRARPAAGAAAVLVLMAASTAGIVHALLTDPSRAGLVGLDRWQYVTDWPSGYRIEDAAKLLSRRASEKGGLVVVRDLASGPLFEGWNVLLRRQGTSGLSFADVALRKGASVLTAPRLLTGARPVCLVLEQPVGLRLVPTLDARRLALPVAILAKPGRSRQIEIDCVWGDCGAAERGPTGGAPLPPDPPPVAVDSPGGLEKARVCGIEEGERGLAACGRALALGLTWPRAAEVHYEAGRILMALGRYTEAARHFEAARRLLPDDVDQSVGHAEALGILGRHEEALAVLRDALRFAPFSDAVHARIGWSAAWLGRWDEAETSLRRSLELAPGSAETRGNLGVVLHLEGRSEEAVLELTEAARLEREALYTRYALAVILAARATAGPPLTEGTRRGPVPPRGGGR